MSRIAAEVDHWGMSEQRNALRILSTLVVAASIGLLASCAPTGGTGGTGDTSGDGGDSGGGSAAGCEAYDGTEVAPFSSSAVTSAPEAGAVWGDGSALSFEMTPEASALLPQITFYSLLDGTVVDEASSVLTETPEGSNTWVTDLNLFNDDQEGQPGIAQVFTVSDQQIDGALNEGQNLVFGRYCVTFKN